LLQVEGAHVRRTPFRAAILAAFLSAPPAAAHLPHDVISEVALWDGAEHTRLVVQYAFPRRPLMMVSEDWGRSWYYRAPQASRNELQTLVFATADVLFAADGVEAVAFCSTDGGETWAATAEPDGTAVVSISPSPGYGDRTTVFAATEAGVHRSDDGGDSWTVLPGPQGTFVDLALAPEHPDDPFVVALTATTLWTSLDNGDTWIDAPLPDGGGEGLTLALSPEFGDDGVLWVGMDQGVVARTDDRGDSWSAIELQLDSEPLDEPIQDLVATSAGRLLAVSENHAALCSGDAGVSWDLCDDGIPPIASGQAGSWGHFRRLDGSTRAAVGAWEGLLLSEDQGETWTESCTLDADFVRGVAFSPGYPADPSLFVGSFGGGLYRTNDGGSSWSVLADDQVSVYVEDVFFSPGYPEHPLILLVADRVLVRSTDGGQSFHGVDLPQMKALHQIALSPAFPEDGLAFAVGTTSNSAQWVVDRSEDWGATWQTIWSGDEPPEAQMVRVVFPEADSSGEVFAAQTSPAAILRSSDHGASWETRLELERGAKWAALLATGDDLVAVTTTGAVWRGRSDWTEVSEVGGDAEIVWGDRGGEALFLLTDPPGLLRSTDGGSTWQTVPTPFQTMVLTAAAPPAGAQDPVIVVATHSGTFFTCDDGASWHLLGTMERMEDDACPLRYAGPGWERLTGEGTATIVTRSATAGDSVEVELQGRAVRWLATPSLDAGTARVEVDGIDLGSVDLFGDSQAPVAVFEHEFDGEGLHTLRITVAGDGVVEVDALEVLREQVSNGPGQHFSSGPWCIDLPDPTATAAAPAAQGCATTCVIGEVAQPRAWLAAVLGAVLLKRRRSRRCGAGSGRAVRIRRGIDGLAVLDRAITAGSERRLPAELRGRRRRLHGAHWRDG
jgi:photosystem II stability/assembly factor-like uncharacterized protein